MNKIVWKRRLQSLAVISLAAASATAVAASSDPVSWPASHVGQATPQSANLPPDLARNLATFDDLDFRVYTNQQWQDLHKSHSQDVIVHWPDGHIARGLQRHIEDLKYMWTFAPDNRIVEHPVRFGTQDAQWTAVTGWLQGTFTQPMVLPNGKVIQPTGKAYRIPMATFGHWNKQGVMFEEYLFWDNAALMQQIGVGS